MTTTPPVFFMAELPTTGLAVLDGPEGHHAAAVRRLRPGEQVVLVDGCGGRVNGEVWSAERDSVTVTVLSTAQEAQPQPRVVLVQALLKGDRGELAVELATEAGVDRIVPWRAARSVAQWDDGPRGHKAWERWRSTAREAAKQSRRSWIPEVTEPMSTKAVAAWIPDFPGAVMLHESAEKRLANVALPESGELVVIVGPEGGIDDQELSMLAAAGAQPVRLGPTVLRASTAAAVALGALGVLTRRWDDTARVDR